MFDSSTKDVQSPDYSVDYYSEENPVRREMR